MTRQEAMDELRKCIPSFNRKYLHWGKVKDKEQDKSWLYKDDFYSQPDGERKNFFLPESIPVDFLVGLEADIDGTHYVARRHENRRDYRKVDLSVTDYACYGNTHKYGTLSIDGVNWKDGDCTTSSRKLSNIDPRVVGIWKVDICKILSNEDLGEKNCDWDGYEANEATCRFSNIDELYCTAAYVALLRIEGKFDLTIDAWCDANPSEATQYLLKVDGDEVRFMPMLKAAKANILDEPF